MRYQPNQPNDYLHLVADGDYGLLEFLLSHLNESQIGRASCRERV